MCSFRYQFPNTERNLDTVSSKKTRRTRRFRYCPFQQSNPSILHWSGWSPPISQCPSAKCSCLGDFRIAQLIVELFLFDLFQLVSLRNVECQWFENLHNDHCHRSPCAGELHSHGHRIFSIREHVHTSERVASSAQLLREVTWVTCIFCSEVLTLNSCKPLYRYKSLAVCLKESLHAIEFDRIAIHFSEQVCLYGAILVLSRSYWTSSRSWLAYIGFTAVKNTDCLSFLLLFPPGISPLWMMECISLAFPMWSSAKSSGNNFLSLNNGSTKKILLNLLELVGSTIIHWMNEDSNNIEAFSSFLLLVPRHLPKHQLSIAKY